MSHGDVFSIPTSVVCNTLADLSTRRDSPIGSEGCRTAMRLLLRPLLTHHPAPWSPVMVHGLLASSIARRVQVANADDITEIVSIHLESAASNSSPDSVVFDTLFAGGTDGAQRAAGTAQVKPCCRCRLARWTEWLHHARVYRLYLSCLRTLHLAKSLLPWNVNTLSPRGSLPLPKLPILDNLAAAQPSSIDVDVVFRSYSLRIEYVD
ncbi:hypothetical protein BKA70DRAFT_1229190 [Coprinopsis sp. MPI-PUGE-AT-0042]|nr:hypothetical protein BKA70DRAFT_1229190 [Coprinopsis sp. MPI-PUGE-AT-0042]